MFKFVTDSVGGVGAKRKSNHPPRSCETCKKRHKRCLHNEPSVSDIVEDVDSADSPSAPPLHHNSPPPTDGSESHAIAPESATASLGVRRDEYLRFVGDLSPEASFLSRNNQSANRNISRHDYVGVWLGHKPEGNSRHGKSDTQAEYGGASHVHTLRGLQTMRDSLIQECLATIPPDYEYGRLSELFYAKVDPLFPILHDEQLDQFDRMEELALKQCICLVASLDPSSRKHLRLPHTEQVLSQIEFRHRLAAAVKYSLDMGYICDKVVALQVCALMAFYVDKAGCSEISSYYCAQVVHHSQTLGLHLGWPKDSVGVEKAQRVFWCVWILDRLNAASNGRPILYHERDMDQTILLSASSQAPVFRLLIRITQFLDETISLYRPHADIPETAGRSSTTFEDMVETAGALEVGSALLASLEMFYLSVVILRSRPNGPKGINRTPSTELQIYCAMHIVSIASEENKSAVTFWPVMPYAVAMATSIAYKSLRNSMIPSNRKRAYALFHSSCEVLDELSKAFLSARVVAHLATETVQEVERLTERRRNQQADTSTAHHESARQPQTTAASSEAPPTSHMLPAPPDLISPMHNFEGEAGIFTDFDPSFDLGRLDALFAANLDPTMPTFPPDSWLPNSFG